MTSSGECLRAEILMRAYAYDDLDRLASDGDVAYTYDAAGNRMTRTENDETITYTLGVGDRLASYGGAASTMPPHSGAYFYDTAGNVTRIERDGKPTLDLTWNSQYQLVSVSTNGVFAEGYAYDALSRRVSTTTLEGTTRHVYDDNWQVIADIDENGSVVASYVWGEDIDNLLAVNIGGATYYPLTDIQGTVWGYVDEYNNIVARWAYDAWGNVLSEEIDSSAVALSRIRYRFQGREWSAATGLINFRLRWYDAETGRWLSKDPIGLSGGLNLYAFCCNNPMNGIDPSGRCPDDDWMDWIHTGLDIIGTFDPTPAADGINAVIYAIEGSWNNAAISAVAIVPYLGDAAKAGKYGAKIIQTGGHKLKPSTLKALGMSKGEGKKAIEALKRENGLPNNWHGKIGADGAVYDRQGNYVDNLNTYR